MLVFTCVGQRASEGEQTSHKGFLLWLEPLFFVTFVTKDGPRFLRDQKPP